MIAANGLVLRPLSLVGSQRIWKNLHFGDLKERGAGKLRSGRRLPFEPYLSPGTVVRHAPISCHANPHNMVPFFRGENLVSASIRFAHHQLFGGKAKVLLRPVQLLMVHEP